MKRMEITLIDKHGTDIGFVAPNHIKGWGNALAEATRQAKAIGGTVGITEYEKVTFKVDKS